MNDIHSNIQQNKRVFDIQKLWEEFAELFSNKGTKLQQGIS
jgi:hypothetical protein